MLSHLKIVKIISSVDYVSLPIMTANFNDGGVFFRFCLYKRCTTVTVHSGLLVHVFQNTGIEWTIQNCLRKSLTIVPWKVQPLLNPQSGIPGREGGLGGGTEGSGS